MTVTSTPVTYIKRLLLPIVLLASFAVGSVSCKKDKLLTSGGALAYSLDTLSFDTVFTASGSFTTQVKLYNPQNQKVNISSIRLEGPNASFFHINVNGISGNATNIELAAKDSMYIFATVNIDPNNVNNPFVVNASVVATLNGKDYTLPLMAYGLNAYYIVDSVLQTQTWKTDKPYVVIHSAEVDTAQTLTIPAGCRIYMNADSRLYVAGTLKVNGTKQDSVIFQGDRLDRNYFGNVGYPGEWGGILFLQTSTNNSINYAVIKNCGSSTGFGYPAAIYMQPDTINDNLPQLVMTNTIVENSIGFGILGIASTIVAQNCLINACGAGSLATYQGGTYLFDNCDFITYGSNKISHIDNPTVQLIDFLQVDDIHYITSPLKAVLTNCVIWGSLDNECGVQKKGDNFDVTLVNCAIKQKDAINDAVVKNRVNTDNPRFVDDVNWNFRLQDGSPLIDAGTTDTFTPVTTDLDGKPRTGKPDIGCYER